MKLTKTLAAFIGAVCVIVLCVAPTASAHTPSLVASLDCNGNVSWTFSSDGFGASFTISDSALGQRGGTMSIGSPAYSSSGNYTVAASVTSGSVTAQINWNDNFNGNKTVTANYSRPGNCQATPTIATTASSGVTVGSKIHDVATLAGASHGTGAVTFQVFAPGDTSCATPLTTLATSSKNVDSDGNGTYTSGDYTTTTVGTHLWRAFFTGDSKNTAVSGTCGALNESSIVNKANPTIATTASSGVTVGSKIHDVATLAGAVGATGAVTFQVFAPGDTTCATPLTTLATSTSSVDSNGNGTYTSGDYTTNLAGTYLWRAFFAGDDKNTAVSGNCRDQGESSITNQATPSISTAASSGVTVGSKIHDVATLSGAVGATGLVTFQVFGPGDVECATPLATLQASSTSVDADGNGTYTSADYTTNLAGAYLWRAFFAADNKNASVSGSCGAPNESSTVKQASPTIATQASAGGTTGVAIHDVATLSGAVGGTGAVTFKLYGPGDSNCANALATVTASTKSVDANGNGTYTSENFTTTTAGTYLWRAFFAGDANNIAVSGACGVANESATVTSPPSPPSTPQNPAIAITKNPKSQSILTGQTATFTIAVTNTGNVTLTNVTVTDQLSPDCNKTSAQIGGLASMAPSASVTYNCSASNVQASFTNVAVATGTPPSGPNVTAQDSAPVTVNAPLTPPKPPPPPKPTHPAIDIVKDPKAQTIGQGDKATFKITVTNTGDVTLTDVTVTDPRSPACNRNLGTFGVGQSKSYSCTKAGVRSGFRNVATVTGTPPSGPKVTANDHAGVNVPVTKPKPRPLHPKIAIVKSPKSQTVATKVTNERSASGATKTTISYGSADFTITVRNTGQVTLHGIVVADPQSKGCERELGTLAPGAFRSYQCGRDVVSSGFTNVASVTGTSPTGQKVHDADHAVVKVAVRTTTTGSGNAGTKKKHHAASFTPPKTTASGSPSFTG